MHFFVIRPDVWILNTSSSALLALVLRFGDPVSSRFVKPFLPYAPRIAIAFVRRYFVGTPSVQAPFGHGRVDAVEYVVVAVRLVRSGDLDRVGSSGHAAMLEG